MTMDTRWTDRIDINPDDFPHWLQEVPDDPHAMRFWPTSSARSSDSEIVAQSPTPGRAPIDEHGHPDSVLLRPEEVGDRLRLSRARIYELMATGELASVTIGRSRRVPLMAVIEFIRSRQA